MDPNEKKAPELRKNTSLTHTVQTAKAWDFSQPSKTSASQTGRGNTVASSSTTNTTASPIPLQQGRSAVQCTVDATIDSLVNLGSVPNTDPSSLENSMSDQSSRLGNEADDENEDDNDNGEHKGRVSKRNKVLVAHNAMRYEKRGSSSEEEDDDDDVRKQNPIVVRQSAYQSCSARSPLQSDGYNETDSIKCLFVGAAPESAPTPVSAFTLTLTPAPAPADGGRSTLAKPRRLKAKTPRKNTETEMTSPQSSSSDWFTPASTSDQVTSSKHYDRSQNARMNYYDRPDDATKEYFDGTENAQKQAYGRTEADVKELCDFTENAANDRLVSSESGTKRSLAHELNVSSKGKNGIESTNEFYDEICTEGHIRVKAKTSDSMINNVHRNRCHAACAMASTFPYIKSTDTPNVLCNTSRTVSVNGGIPNAVPNTLSVQCVPLFKPQDSAEEVVHVSRRKLNADCRGWKQRVDSQDSVAMQGLASKHAETKPHRTVQFLGDNVNRHSAEGRPALNKSGLFRGQRGKRKSIMKKHTLPNPAAFGCSLSGRTSNGSFPNTEQRKATKTPSHTRMEMHFQETMLSRITHLKDDNGTAKGLQTNPSYRKLADMYGSRSHLNESLTQQNISYLHDVQMDRRGVRCSGRKRLLRIGDLVHTYAAKPPAPPETKATFKPLNPTLRLPRCPSAPKVMEPDSGDEPTSPSTTEASICSGREANDLLSNEKEKEDLLNDVRHPQKLPPLCGKKIVTLHKVGKLANGCAHSVTESAETKDQQLNLSSKKIPLRPFPGLTESIRQLEELRRLHAMSGREAPDMILKERVDPHGPQAPEPADPEKRSTPNCVITCHITGKGTITVLDTQQVAIDLTQVLGWNFTFDSDDKGSFDGHPDSMLSSSYEHLGLPETRMDPGRSAVSHETKLQGDVSRKSGESHSYAKYERQPREWSLHRDQGNEHELHERSTGSRWSQNDPSSFSTTCEKFVSPADRSRSPGILREKESICLLCAAEASPQAVSKGSCGCRSDNICHCSAHGDAAALHCSILPEASVQAKQRAVERDLVASLNTDVNCKNACQNVRLPAQPTCAPVSAEVDFYRYEEPRLVADSNIPPLSADSRRLGNRDGYVDVSPTPLLNHDQNFHERHLDESHTQVCTRQSSGDSVPKNVSPRAKVSTKCSHAGFPPVRVKSSSSDALADFVDRSDRLMHITLRMAAEEEILKSALTATGGKKPKKKAAKERGDSCFAFGRHYKERNTPITRPHSHTVSAKKSQGKVHKLPGKNKNLESQGKCNKTEKTPKETIHWKEHVLEDGVVWYEAVNEATTLSTTEKKSDGNETLQKSEDAEQPPAHEAAPQSGRENPDHTSKVTTKKTSDHGDSKSSQTSDGPTLRFLFSTKTEDLTTTTFDSSCNASSDTNVGRNDSLTAGALNHHVTFPAFPPINASTDVATGLLTDSLGDDPAFRTRMSTTVDTVTRLPVDQASQLTSYGHELAGHKRQPMNKVNELAPSEQQPEIESYTEKKCVPIRLDFHNLASFTGSLLRERLFKDLESYFTRFPDNEQDNEKADKNQKERENVKDTGNATCKEDDKSEDSAKEKEGEKYEQNHEKVKVHQRQQEEGVLKDSEVSVTQLIEYERDEEEEKENDAEKKWWCVQENSEPQTGYLFHFDEANSKKKSMPVKTRSFASLEPKEQECAEQPPQARNQERETCANKKPVLHLLQKKPERNVTIRCDTEKNRIDPDTANLSRLLPSMTRSWKHSLKPITPFVKLDPRRVSSTSNIQGKASICKAFLLKIPKGMLSKITRSPRGHLKTHDRRGKREVRRRRNPKRDLKIVAPYTNRRRHGNQRSEDLGSKTEGRNEISLPDDAPSPHCPSLIKTCEHAYTNPTRPITRGRCKKSGEQSGEQVLSQEAGHCSGNHFSARENGPQFGTSDSNSSHDETEDAASRITTTSENWDSDEVDELPGDSEDSSDPTNLSNNCRHRGRPRLSDVVEYVVDDFLPYGDRKAETFREIQTGHRAREPTVWSRLTHTNTGTIPFWQTVWPRLVDADFRQFAKWQTVCNDSCKYAASFAVANNKRHLCCCQLDFVAYTELHFAFRQPQNFKSSPPSCSHAAGNVSRIVAATAGDNQALSGRWPTDRLDYGRRPTLRNHVSDVVAGQLSLERWENNV